MHTAQQSNPEPINAPIRLRICLFLSRISVTIGSRMMQYNWQHPNWPHFSYDLSEIHEVLYQYAMEASALSGKFNELTQENQLDALIDLMVTEAVNTSQIEGEIFDPEDVRSSVKRELGLSAKPVRDQKADGIGQLMVSVQKTFQETLTEPMLYEWHRMLMSGSRLHSADIGGWRTSADPMQIVSGAMGQEKVHFEAPPSYEVERHMSGFIQWFNQTDPFHGNVKIVGPVRAAVAHLYFESIHPFEDGNGRIGRALSEKILSQELGHPVLLSLSRTLQKNKKNYYRELSFASHSNSDLDITSWIKYFVNVVYQAQQDTREQIVFVLQKARFWRNVENKLNERQEKVLQRIFKAGVAGFEGDLSAQKYMKISKCSKATATRDLAELLDQGLLVKLPGGGRSTRYKIALSS